MVEAIPALTTEKSVKLFTDFNVFTEAELKARAEIQFEAYAKAINIEAKTMIQMASKQLIPAIIKYATSLADSVNTVKAAGANASVQAGLLEKVSDLLVQSQKALDNLNAITNEAASQDEGQKQAVFYHDVVVPAMNELRAPIDELEMIVDKEEWPMPSYGDLLFEV